LVTFFQKSNCFFCFPSREIRRAGESLATGKFDIDILCTGGHADEVDDAWPASCEAMVVLNSEENVGRVAVIRDEDRAGRGRFFGAASVAIKFSAGNSGDWQGSIIIRWNGG